MRVTRGRFDACAGRDAGDDHLRHPELFKVALEIGVRKGPPGPLDHAMVYRLRIELRHQIAPPGGLLPEIAGRLFGPSRGRAGDGHPHHRQAMAPQRGRELARTLDDLRGGMDRG